MLFSITDSKPVQKQHNHRHVEKIEIEFLDALRVSRKHGIIILSL